MKRAHQGRLEIGSMINYDLEEGEDVKGLDVAKLGHDKGRRELATGP